MRKAAFAMALAFCFGASTLRGQSAFGKGASLLSPAVQEKDRKPAASSPPTRAQGCETCECEARRRIAVMEVDVGNVSPEARSSFSWSPEKIQGEIIAVLSEKPRVSAMTPAEALPILAAATTPGVLASGVGGRRSVEPQMAAQAQLFVRIGPVEISHNDVREVSPEVEATLREARELDQRSSSLFTEAKEENERAGYESRRAADSVGGKIPWDCAAIALNAFQCQGDWRCTNQVNQQVADCKRQAAARLQEAQASAASAASSGYLASSANKLAEARRLNERALDLAVTAQRLLREGATLSRVTSAEATLKWKLVDSRSKEVLGEGNASGAESAKASGLPADVSAVDSTPEGRSLGRAAVDAAISVSIRSAAEAIANRVSAVPFRAKAVRVERREVTINAGTNLGVRVGDTFGMRNTAVVLTDPDTGRPLEAAPKSVGRLRVVRVQEKVAVARDLDHNLRIKRGDEVEWIGFSEPGLGEHREATPRLAPRP